jgi:hypothetical protein
MGHDSDENRFSWSILHFYKIMYQYRKIKKNSHSKQDVEPTVETHMYNIWRLVEFWWNIG